MDLFPLPEPQPFDLLDPAGAVAFLKTFPGFARRRGQSLYARGTVDGIEVIEPGVAYSAVVIDGEEYDVDLDYDKSLGWSATCSCGIANCPHGQAAMQALLAEYRQAAVRKLSEPQVIDPNAAISNKNGKKPTDQRVAVLLKQALGRSLNGVETKYTSKIASVYHQAAETRRLTGWDIQELGFKWNHSWEQLKIWPSFPQSEQEFWLYLAAAAQERNHAIPEFMRPITDLAPIEKSLTQWHRRQEIEKWQQTLSRLPEDLITGPPDEGELRVMVTVEGAQLQIRRPGQPEFVALKQTPFNQMLNRDRDGKLSLTGSSEVLWRIFRDQNSYTTASMVDLSRDENFEWLRRLLRIPGLENQIVNFEGRPFERRSEQLKWNLEEPVDPKGDYTLRLVKSDGSAAPKVLCSLPGKPALYLTESAIFEGPAAMPGLLNAGEATRIPAVVIEQQLGVNFLLKAGVAMPSRIRERVRTLPFKVTISCDLKTPPYGGSEECVVAISADAEDGRREKWSGAHWQELTSGGPRVKKTESGLISIYDRSALGLFPMLIEPLNLKNSYYNGTLTARVTKKFPEIFAGWLKSLPPSITVKLSGELESLAQADVAGRVKLEVTEKEIDWFDLQVMVDVSDTQLTPQEIKLLLDARGGYVRLKGKGWRRLQYDLSEEEDSRLAQLGLNPRELTSDPQRLHALQLAHPAAKKFMPEEQVAQVERRASEIRARVSPALPSALRADLRAYQLEGYNFLAYLSTNRFGGILADDMGLGKTLQTLAWLLWLRQDTAAAGAPPVIEIGGGSKSSPATSVAPSLVVCPKSVMDNWHAEAIKFAPDLRVKVWPPTPIEKFREQLGEADLHVMNYSQLRSFGESLAPIHWQAVILDEGQYIKNPNSQTAQAARLLKASHRLVLSGTPIENRLMDLWSLMSFAMPGVLGSRAQFGKLYDGKDDPFARHRLSSRVRPFLLRRTKTQVAKDLPDKTEEDLFCEIEGEQKLLYRAELKRAQQMLLSVKTQKELAKEHFNFLTSLLRLRQICCHPRLLNAESKAPSAKMEALLEQLEPLMEEGHKVLVFSQFVGLLELVQEALRGKNWPYFCLTGSTENRGELVKNFQESKGASVFLISLKAGGFGLNLTAASYVVLFDPWWNPAVENQAIDRTHRIGQTNKVIAYRLLIKNSIEEKIRVLQKKKSALADDVLGEERFAQSLTLQDLQFLLAD
jgi:hypothetical protein